MVNGIQIINVEPRISHLVEITFIIPNLIFTQSQLGFIFCFSGTLTVTMERRIVRTTIERQKVLYANEMIERGIGK